MDDCENEMILFTVTPSFEPKRGKFMAYNKDKEIVIVDTSNWDVKKKLSDESVRFSCRI